jgi:hypothetical protein
LKTFNNSVRSRDLRVPTTTAHKIKRLRLCHCAVRAPSDVWVRVAARVPDLTNLIRHSPPPWCFYVSPAVCPNALSTPPPPQVRITRRRHLTRWRPLLPPLLSRQQPNLLRSAGAAPGPNRCAVVVPQRNHVAVFACQACGRHTQQRIVLVNRAAALPWFPTVVNRWRRGVSARVVLGLDSLWL